MTLACKTGSPQRPERAPGGGYYTNSVLIGYFPAEAPRYAAAVVLEYGGGGANAAPVLRSHRAGAVRLSAPRPQPKKAKAGPARGGARRRIGDYVQKYCPFFIKL